MRTGRLEPGFFRFVPRLARGTPRLRPCFWIVAPMSTSGMPQILPRWIMLFEVNLLRWSNCCYETVLRLTQRRPWDLVLSSQPEKREGNVSWSAFYAMALTSHCKIKMAALHFTLRHGRDARSSSIDGCVWGESSDPRCGWTYTNRLRQRTYGSQYRHLPGVPTGDSGYNHEPGG